MSAGIQIDDLSGTVLSPSIDSVTVASFDNVTMKISFRQILDLWSQTTEAQIVPRLDENSLPIPNGTTGDRPLTPVEYALRGNTDRDKLEMYIGGQWKDAGGGPSLGPDSIIRTNSNTLTESVVFPDNTNGMSAGPITIADGVTVEIPSGSNWVIV